MTQDEYTRKLEELDSILNDPDVPMNPARVWTLLADLSGADPGSGARRRPGAELAGMSTAGTAD